MLASKALAAAVSQEPVYVEDVFSTYLYTGNGANQVIQNNIALSNVTDGGSAYFPSGAYYGSGSQYPVQLSSNINLSGNFTIEFWIYRDGNSGNGECIFSPDYGSTGSNIQIGIQYNTGALYIYDGTNRVGSTTNNVPLNGWFHVAYSRSGSTVYYWVNGVSAGTATTSYAFAINTIGSLGGYGGGPVGKISNLRISNSARYTSAFTPPTSALSVDANTLFLAFQGASPFVDQTGNRTLTVNPTVTASEAGPIDTGEGGYGGLVWMKGRSGATDHALYDTLRGATKDLVSNSTAAETTQSTGLTAFSGTGFSIGALAKLNTNAATYASWTFRKAPKFFDVVTWTGDNVNGRVIPHSLNAEVGFIVVKAITTSANDNNWVCRHRSQTSPDRLYLNTTAAASGSTNLAPTTTGFTVYANGYNETGVQYVAYLFAHNAGGFGLSGTDNVISCGSWTGTGTSPGPTITLGWEPQLILYKRASGGTGDWGIHDNMRDLGVGTSSTSGSGNRLEPNTADAETGPSNFANISATGFTITATVADINASGSTYIYIAIRRGPMKVPTSGTSVFSPIARAGTSSNVDISTGFVTDAAIIKIRSGGYVGEIFDRLRGANKRLYPDQTSAESTTTDHLTSFASNTGYTLGASSSGEVNASGYNYINWNFRRAPGFFDVVCYTGTGVARTVDHNLGVAPELMIVKSRTANGPSWMVYSNTGTLSQFLQLNGTDAFTTSTNLWNSNPTSTQFSLAGSGTYYTYVNNNGENYVAYLFATLAGVSKVGSYTGNGSSQTINCGFSSGARFVLIKRTDSTGNWLVADSARGIVAGNDPLLYLNSTAAEITTLDWIDANSSGFIVNQESTANANVNAATYIFLAIA